MLPHLLLEQHFLLVLVVLLDTARLQHLLVIKFQFVKAALQIVAELRFAVQLNLLLC